MLGGLILAACGALFVHHYWSRLPREERASSLSVAHVLLAREDYERTIEVLDAIDTRTLDAPALAQWLNLKANALALAGRADEALDLLDDLASVADANDAAMQLCLTGNRALAHLHAGRLELAAQLLDDTEAAARALAAADDRYAPESLAETWFWRAELARRQQAPERERECLTRAAEQGDTLHAHKARQRLDALLQKA